MRISRDLILFAVVLIGAAGAGIWVLETTQHSDVEASQQVQEVAANEIERIPYAESPTVSNVADQDEVIQKQFEDFINNFLDKLTEDIRAYKLKRQIVRDLVQPVNVRNAEYLKENFEMLKQLSEEMNRDMDDIIYSFEVADKKIHNLVSTSITGNKNIILNKWKAIKQEQLEIYVAYFILEKELLLIYLEMFGFYMANGTDFKVNVAENKIIFSSSNDRNKYENFLSQIENVRRESVATLSRFTSEQNSETSGTHSVKAQN